MLIILALPPEDGLPLLLLLLVPHPHYLVNILTMRRSYPKHRNGAILPAHRQLLVARQRMRGIQVRLRLRLTNPHLLPPA